MRSLIFFFFIYFFSAFLFLTNKNFNVAQNHIFLIKDGESFSIIKNRLEDLKITIPFLVDFYFYTSGADKSLRKGEYLIDKGSDLFSFSTNLAKGKIYYRSFYIPEGSIVTQFLSDKEQNSFCIYKGLEECELEGMFHPNTYYFELGENINELLNEAFNTQLLIATEQFEKIKENKIVKDVYDLITIASILEKESCPNERSLISGIIYNRLEKGMKLQIDSTVIYGIENFNGNLTKNDLRKSTPFNSYTNYGLPPKPISTPSKSSLIAAANPTQSEYLYFVSKGKCAHQFSKSYPEHMEAIKKYQLN